MINKKRYRAFCKKENKIPIFSKDWWLDSVCGYDNWDVVIIEKGGNIFATMPYYIEKKYGLTIIKHPKLTQTSGVYFKYPKNQKYSKKLSFEKEMINEIIAQLPKFDKFSQSFHHTNLNLLPFYWAGFDVNVRYTYVINNLDNLDAVFNNVSSNYRNKIRKASKEIIIKKNMDINKFYEINMMTFDRQNLQHPYSLDYIIDHDKYLTKINCREIFYAEDKDGNIHSALYLTWDANSSYMHMLGENPVLRKSSAGILLVWKAIKYTKEVLKLNNFNFEGSMIESIEQVRRNFGAIQQPYYNISKINSKLLKFQALLK